MRALNWLRGLRKNERGNVLVIGAATMPLLMGAAAIGIDSITLSLARRQLQRAADSSALAGAYALAQEKTAATSVDYDLSLNNKITLASKTIENAPTTGTYVNNPRAVRVVLSAVRPTPFMSFFKNSDTTVRVEATAAVVYNGKFCMVSLETGTATGVSFSGNSTVDLGCGVATNAKGSTAISANGSATVIASPIAAMGNVPSSTAYATGTKLLPYSPQQTDPYAHLTQPVIPAGACPALNVQPQQTQNLQPGCYSGMDIKGTANLAPGTYYVNGSSFNAGAQSVIRGTGVTIVLTSSNPPTIPIASVSIHGGAQLNLTAPSSGPFGGVLMYQDPRATLGNTVTINGNSLSSYEGGFYFPKAYLTFNGTSGMNTQCLQIVARRLAFSGNSSVSNTCPADSASKAFDAILVRLVA